MIFLPVGIDPLLNDARLSAIFQHDPGKPASKCIHTGLYRS